MEYTRGRLRSRQIRISVPVTIAILFFVSGAPTDVYADLGFEPNGKSTPAIQDENSDSQTQEKETSKSESTTQDSGIANTQTPEPRWVDKPKNLLDSDSLDGWELLNFGGEGDVEVVKGVLMLGSGDPFTGVSSTRDDLPKTNYEISLSARKTQGIDFFCGLTFPVAESHCTLVVGGWGGGLVGLSCIDDLDASHNDTQSIMKFETNRWYKIRVRVEPKRISTWIDGKQVINQDIAGKKISLRGDVTLCRPLGLCSFQTDAELKDIHIRRFKSAAESKPSPDTSSTKSNPEK